MVGYIERADWLWRHTSMLATREEGFEREMATAAYQMLVLVLLTALLFSPREPPLLLISV